MHFRQKKLKNSAAVTKFVTAALFFLGSVRHNPVFHLRMFDGEDIGCGIF